MSYKDDKELKEKVFSAFEPTKKAPIDMDKVKAAFDRPPTEDAVKREKTDEDKRRELAEGLTLRIGPYDTGIEMSQEMVEFLAGAGKRLSEIGTLGTHEADSEVERLLGQSGYATAGEVVSDIASMAAGGSVLRGAGAAAGLGRAATSAAPQAVAALPGKTSLASRAVAKVPDVLKGDAAKAALGAGAYGALTDPDRKDAAVAGALGGALGTAAPKVLGKVISPRVKGAAKDLVKDGATLTPGELLGGGVKAVEDAITSMPVVGHTIKGAKRRSLEQWNKGVINDVLKPIGKNLNKTTKAGADSIAEAQKKVSKEYDNILVKMNTKVDQEFSSQMKQLFEMVGKLPEKSQRHFRTLYDDHIYKVFNNKTQTALGRTFKESDSAIRADYKRLLKAAERNADMDKRQLGNAVRQMHFNLMELGRRSNPKLAKRLDNANKSYAKLSVVEDAAYFLGSEDRLFGPSQMLNAIRKRTGRKDWGGGKGFNQKQVDAATAILPSSVPDLGTAGRLASLFALFGGGMFDPALAGGMLAGAAPYTRPGVKLMQQAITAGRGPGTRAVRAGLEKAAVPAGLLSGAAALQVD